MATREYYYVLDNRHLLNEVFYGTTKQVCKFLKNQVTENNIKRAVKNQNEFMVDGRQCIIVEDFEKNKGNSNDDDEEIWRLFDEGKKCAYYVSDQGRVKRKRKCDDKEFAVEPWVNGRNEAIVTTNGKTRQLKNLVAKYFLPEYEEMMKETTKPLVRVKGKDPTNCTANNLVVYRQPKTTRKSKQRWRKCALYEDGVKVKEYSSAKEAAEDLVYDRSDICKYFNGVKHVKSLPFDLREV